MLFVFKNSLWNAEFVANNFAIPVFCRGTLWSEFFFLSSFGVTPHSTWNTHTASSLDVHFHGHRRKLWRWFSTERLPSFCEVCSYDRPEYEDGLDRYCLLVRDALYFGRALSRFIQHAQTTRHFVPSTQLNLRHTPYFGEVFVYRGFSRYSTLCTAQIAIFPSQFWRRLLITGRVVGVRFPVGEGRYCGYNQPPSFQWVFGINRP